MPDIFLYQGEATPSDIKLRDPTTLAGGATLLVVQDATHTHAGDNLALIQHHVLAMQDALHAHAADTFAIVQHHLLALQDALHAQAADNLVLVEHVQGVTLVIADALHAHSANSLVVIQHHVLAVAEAAHAHAADNIALVQHHALAIAEALHAQSADGLTLTQHHVLAIQDAAHGLTSTVIKLGGAAPPPDAPIEVTAEFGSISVRGSHINSMGWLAVAGERRARLRSIFRAHRLQREEDEIRRMQKRAKRRPIDRQTK